MDFFDLVNLLGGLALFLYGMSTLGSGLEKLSGGRLESVLEKMTDTVVKGVLLGAAVTAAVQSSSATTVIVVGLVNAGLLKLRQAIGVIMGANIGTTVTAHILRLTDISSDNFLLNLLKPTNLSPIIALVGILLFMAGRKRIHKEVGQILLGFSVLFTGMFAMEGAVHELREMPQMAMVFARLSNPVLGVIAGAVLTAVIQSSSASVGILQALSSAGLITYGAAFPIIMGQNIGTTVTPIMASIGAGRSAKRAALIHLIFNLLGTALFLTATYAIHYTIGFSFWDSPIDKGGIANFHTLFNVVVTVIFLPLSGLLEKIVTFLVKPTEQELRRQQKAETIILDDRFMVSPGLALEQAQHAVGQMAELAEENCSLAFELFRSYDNKKADLLQENESAIDRLEDRLRVYLLNLSGKELADSDSKRISSLLNMMTEFERIGDYAVNIGECAQQLAEKGLALSSGALAEYNVITAAAAEIVSFAGKTFTTGDVKAAQSIEPLEETIDLMEELLKARHIERLKAGECSIDVALPFIDMLSHLERISDHCSNIGVYIIGYSKDEISDFDRHEYIRMIHQGNTLYYKEQYAHFEGKYIDRLSSLSQQK